MQIELPIQPEYRPAAQDAADRLAVIFPKLDIALEGGCLLMSNVPDALVDETRQVARDQLIRSRYAAETAGLRATLYRRLLG